MRNHIFPVHALFNTLHIINMHAQNPTKAILTQWLPGNRLGQTSSINITRMITALHHTHHTWYRKGGTCARYQREVAALAPSQHYIAPLAKPAYHSPELNTSITVPYHWPFNAGACVMMVACITRSISGGHEKVDMRIQLGQTFEGTDTTTEFIS